MPVDHYFFENIMLTALKHKSPIPIIDNIKELTEHCAYKHMKDIISNTAIIFLFIFNKPPLEHI